jgi:serine/threonine protein kinase/tetratricopeptide (TPR) repeat protein
MPGPPNESATSGEPDPKQLEALFNQAVEMAPVDRAVFLDAACGGYKTLREHVERLLAASTAAEGNPIWREPAVQGLARASAEATAPAIDRYLLLKRIGVGGMGVVYKAVRSDDAFSKEVAIKIVQWAAGDETVLRHFRTERQILANLEHPNIARLLDGGIAADGSPYLVMEFVQGIPISKYVAERTPSLRAILEMFRRICAAVSYAHRNLIVHRDIKPGNILVADGPDGAPEPKLLDFGIARLLDDSPEPTRTRAMTLEYASPEQLSGAPIGIASDIYSLGVLLYELVTGVRPYRPTTSPMDLAEAICKDDPRPLDASIDADLGKVLLMSMRKEPSRRYESAGQFSEDIRRFLEGYPVIARPDTRRYRVSKFVGRNRLPVAGAGLVALTLAGGIWATISQSRIANRRFNDVRNLANYFVADVHDAIKDLPGALPVRKIIVGKALEYLDSLSRDQSNDGQLQAELAAAYEQIAHVQGGLHDPSNLGDHAGALASYRKAAAIRERLVEAHPRDRNQLKGLAECYSSLGSTQAQYMGDLQNGAATLRKAVAFGERAVAAGRPDAGTEDVLADAYLMLGDALGNASYQNLGDAKGATELYRKALAIRERLANREPGNQDRQMHLAMAENRLGMVLQSQGDLSGSLPPLQRVLAIDEKALAADPENTSKLLNTATANRNLALVLSRSGKPREGLPFVGRAGTLYERLVVANPKDLSAQRFLAGNYYAIGSMMNDDAKAIPLFDAAIEAFRKIQKEQPGSAPEVGWRTTLKYRSEAANRLGNTVVALESAEQLKEIADGLLQTSPENFAARADRCRALALLGVAYQTRHRKTGSSADLGRAASNFQRALDGYSILEKKAPLSRTDKAAMTLSGEALNRIRATR